MLPGLALAAILLSSAPDPDPGDARAELDACARRIEELKAARRDGEEAGRDLERLLRRAQELAAELDRTAAASAANLPLPPQGPGPEELRERADAARDEADRLAAEIGEIDVRIQDAQRIARGASGQVQGAAIARSALPASDRVRELLARRAVLAQRRMRAESEAARLEAEARSAERIP